MIKKICLSAVSYLFAFATFACPNALPTNDPNFCASFKTAAKCYCTSSGVPSGMCEDMHQLYSRMVAVYGSLENACRAQKYTTMEDCLNNWNCYLYGIDSHQRVCSPYYSRCP
ncbi:hypothetical protein B6N58_04950 [Legionella micdadei]|uniref:Uncharacterized protein n=1 Tax=Legionella micdadei TaxID=451 RepID=A0A098GJ36_LEGMI|nr:hypothetical protein B6N58_04950 [Legionella micdadei]ARH00675.1 hypothetical protein B6V88_09745 [Legionella micdadei]KTD26791.1 hypothetical protein Lmic_2885 [Legionella micdadei]CEG61511.1 conserved exported protein of unknown function [Legionella micdadei]SCY44671.1 hypothetical protein SAMN02982997_01718 [Legionella micdadei]